MSGQSPSVVLYSSSGIELDVQTSTAIPAGTGAILISGVNPAGNATWAPSSSDGVIGITQMANHQVAQAAATVTTSGSFTTTLMFAGAQEIALVVDAGTVTGAGTITYTIQEIDTVGNVYGNSASTSAISTGNAPGVFTAVLNITTAMNFKITWTVVSTFSATITSYVISKSTPSTQTINGTVTATNNSVGSDAAAALAFDTQVGGKTTTAAPTYVTGNLDALSLTTLGGLRIDGVYAAATANATAADVMNSGGYVTTAAPTYTTGQLNPFSLTTTGQLRIDAAYPTATAVGSAPDMMNNGAQVTTAAPAYSTATVNALSLTTAGQLRIDGVSATGAAPGSDAMLSGGSVTTAAPAYTTGQMSALSLTTAGQLRIDGVTATGAAPGSDAMLSGGSVTTAAPAYTTGQMSALSLNTAGGLRLDGVSATAAATGSTAMLSGGAVTTAAPAYTTGQMDPLSLTTTGLLRIDGVYPINATTPTTDVTFVGGSVTTAAPSYTTGQLSALSLDTSGNLRVTGFVTTNKATTANVISVAVSATTATSLLASNANRVFASLYNNGTKGTMYVLLGGGTSSATNFSITLLPNTYWEVPVDWTGAISCFATNASTVLCTELTP